MNIPERIMRAGSSIVLGACANAHLGDTLCISPLPRVLSERLITVYVEDYPNARAVFANNPFIRGFRKDGGVPLLWRARGKGHVIQQVFQGLELPLEPVPRPELYLDRSERAWAGEQRRLWPADKPVCVLSTGAITDSANVGRVDWAAVVRIISQHCTVVQAISCERSLDGALAYRNLSTRNYMALIAAADLFIGGTSGGSHVAAAFNVPSLIVIWRALHQDLTFPASGKDVRAAFLYPQHWFVSAENLEGTAFNEAVLEGSLIALLRHGRAGRPTLIGKNPRHPCGFAPQPPARVLLTVRRKLIPVPVKYGEPCLVS